MLSTPDRETSRQPGQRIRTDVVAQYLSQHIVPDPPIKSAIQERLLQQFPNLHPTIYRDGLEAANQFLKEWVLNQEHDWRPIGFPDPETGFGEAIIRDKTTGEPTHYLYSSHQTPTHEKAFLGIVVPISEVDVVLSLNQMKNEEGRVLTADQIMKAIDPGLLSAEETKKKSEQAHLALRKLPEYSGKTDSYEQSFIQKKILNHFIQQAQLSNMKDHVATFEKAQDYTNATYDFIDDHEMGNKVIHAFMDEENKLFFDTKGNRASLIDWLNEHYGQNGVSFSVSYKVLDPQVATYLTDLIKNVFYSPYRTTYHIETVDNNLAYLASKSIPMLNVTYSYEGTSYTREVPILGIQTCDSLKPAQCNIEKDKSHDHVAIQIDEKTLSTSPAHLVHEIDHIVKRLIQIDRLGAPDMSLDQDYDRVLTEGTASLVAEDFLKNQENILQYQAKHIMPFYSLFVANRQSNQLQRTVNQAREALEYFNEHQRPLPHRYPNTYWYLDGRLITEACRQLLPDRFFHLMYETPSLEAASMIDLENTIGRLHKELQKNLSKS